MGFESTCTHNYLILDKVEEVSEFVGDGVVYCKTRELHITYYCSKCLVTEKRTETT